jgi:hypothetical protein
VTLLKDTTCIEKFMHPIAAVPAVVAHRTYLTIVPAGTDVAGLAVAHPGSK